MFSTFSVLYNLHLSNSQTFSSPEKETTGCLAIPPLKDICRLFFKKKKKCKSITETIKASPPSNFPPSFYRGHLYPAVAMDPSHPWFLFYYVSVLPKSMLFCSACLKHLQKCYHIARIFWQLAFGSRCYALSLALLMKVTLVLFFPSLLCSIPMGACTGVYLFPS